MIPITKCSLSNVIAVVPAAGTGKRMLTKFPKQYFSINGKTILEHSITPLLEHPLISTIIIVISSNDKYFNLLPIAKNPDIIVVVTDGKNRTDSVITGLKVANGAANWVLVHDAVRPCLHISDLTRLLQLTKNSHVGGILAFPVRDTIKCSIKESNTIQHTVKRDALWHALTPQLFPLLLLLKCLLYARNKGAIITDEASAMEYSGYHPELIIGRTDNLKVTSPEDLARVQFYLLKLNNN